MKSDNAFEGLDDEHTRLHRWPPPRRRPGVTIAIAVAVAVALALAVVVLASGW